MTVLRSVWLSVSKTAETCDAKLQSISESASVLEDEMSEAHTGVDWT